MAHTILRTTSSVALCGFGGLLGGLANVDAVSAAANDRFWAIYATYLTYSLCIGLLQPPSAWLAGCVILPVHWIVFLASGAQDPVTSTIGVGHLLVLLLSVPPALMAQLGCLIARRIAPSD